nr:general secretion pathway protein [Allomuricauda sp.]
MLCLVGISIQDFRDRLVYWILFPVLGILLVTVHSLCSPHIWVLGLNVLMNLLLIAAVLLLTYLYSKIFRKEPFVDHSLGLGDILFFVAMALGFPTVTFLVLFVCSLLFSLLSFMTFKERFKNPTVPLAGLMGVFLILVLGYSVFVDEPDLYAF